MNKYLIRFIMVLSLVVSVYLLYYGISLLSSPTYFPHGIVIVILNSMTIPLCLSNIYFAFTR
jgi:hypothetical protein